MRHWLVTFERSAHLKIIQRTLANVGCQSTDSGSPQHGDAQTMLLAVMGPEDLPERIEKFPFIKAVRPDTRF